MKKFGDRRLHLRNRQGYDQALRQYIIEYKGIEVDRAKEEINQYFIDRSTKSNDSQFDQKHKTYNVRPIENSEAFFISFGTLKNSEPINTTFMLIDRAFVHSIAPADSIIFDVFVLYNFNATTESRYNSSCFRNFLIDSGAAIRSTKGIGQLKALQRLNASIKFDETTADAHNFIFGLRNISSIEIIDLTTSLRSVIFHIVEVNTPFLLCSADLDNLKTFFNNIINGLVQQNLFHPVVRKFDHVFLPLHQSAYSFIQNFISQNPCFLTEVEFRRLHRRFGHPSVRRFHEILERIDHEADFYVLQHLTKYCEQCQKHNQSFGRFIFFIKDDIEFNFNIIVDIFYLQSKSVIHIVDETTRFQSNR